MWYRNKLAVFILVLVLVTGGLFLFKDRKIEENTVEEAGTAQSGEITVNGTIACLPYIISVADQGCVKAIKGDDGKIYALNSLEVGGKESTMSEGTQVKAVGTFEPANTSVDDAKVFKYDGVMVLRILETR